MTDIRQKLRNRWHSMRWRCRGDNHPRYGGRGIRVCEEWDNSFEAFAKWALANGFKPELSLDRVDFNGHYSPENCRWTTVAVQNQNTSTFGGYNAEQRAAHLARQQVRRARELIEKRAGFGAGLVRVTVTVPKEHEHALRFAARALSDNRQLTLQVLHGRDGRPYFIAEPAEAGEFDHDWNS